MIIIVSVLIIISIIIIIIAIIVKIKVTILNHLHDKLLVSRKAEVQDAEVDCCSQVVRVGDEAELPGVQHHDGGDDCPGLPVKRGWSKCHQV